MPKPVATVAQAEGIAIEAPSKNGDRSDLLAHYLVVGSKIPLSQHLEGDRAKPVSGRFYGTLRPPRPGSRNCIHQLVVVAVDFD